MKFVCIKTKNFRTEHIWESRFPLHAPLLLHQNIFFSWNLPNPLKDWKCFIRNFHQNKLNANTELNQLKFTFTISKAETFCKQDFTRFFALRTEILFPDLVETTNLISYWSNSSDKVGLLRWWSSGAIEDDFFCIFES